MLAAIRIFHITDVLVNKMLILINCPPEDQLTRLIPNAGTARQGARTDTRASEYLTNRFTIVPPHHNPILCQFPHES